MTFIYFARNPITKLIKIGLSHNVKGRLQCLAQVQQTKLRLQYTIARTDKQIHRFKSMRDVERTLHYYFREYHCEGEWFALPTNYKSLIDEALKLRNYTQARTPQGYNLS